MLNNIKDIEVFINNELLGELALLPSGEVAFEYNENFIKKGFSISPFLLPLSSKLYISKKDPFNGLFGVFSDSLPDGFGNLLVDRFLQSKGINSREINVLQRLLLLNDNSMGALSYKPKYIFKDLMDSKLKSFDEIFNECKKILNNKDINNIDDIFQQGGSNGGARPKVYHKSNNKEYLVKFHTKEDGKDSGAIEYVYYLMAKNAGITMPLAELLPSNFCQGYFKVERFDRENNQKIHMHSLAGLCNVDFRVPSIDYKDIMLVTMELTKDIVEVKKVFQQAVFNIYSSNKDDHAKNFAYLYKNNKWQLSPAFDLTYSEGFNFEHNTLCMGKGKNITAKDIYALGKENGLSNNFIKETIEKTKESLSHWVSLAKEYDVEAFSIKKINKSLMLNREN